MIREKGCAIVGGRARRMVATATAFTFLCQNFAWAVCADGTTFPAGGYVNGQAPAANWSPGFFAETAGSVFVLDNSVFENNDPTQPLTGGGHNWVFGPTETCKMIDTGPAGGAPTAWAFSPNQDDCINPPIIKGGVVLGFGNGSLFQGGAITPTCNPALLSQPGAPNPANTRLNQLGCAISHGAATSPQSATTFVFLTGFDINSHLSMASLQNVTNPVVGGPAGKTVAAISTYADIPDGQQLSTAAVSPDGMFAIAASLQKPKIVYACLNPMGDPGDPSLPVDSNFSVPVGITSQVKCMQVVSSNLTADLTTAFGPDNQPYFGGQPSVNSRNIVNSVNTDPGGSIATAWPQCIFNGFSFANPAPTTLMGKLQAVFNAHSANHCGNAQANMGFIQAVPGQALIAHGSYMYVPTDTRVVQFKVTVDPVSGLSEYASRTYLSGLSGFFVSGLGVADDLKSLMTFTQNSTGFPIVKVPLCEDIP